MNICLRCYGARFVCEAHPDMAWDHGPNACTCGAPGEPCPVCNQVAEGETPEMPDGFVTLAKREPGQ